MQYHTLEECRIREIERKAERASSRLYEIDSLRSEVDSLQRTNRELSSQADGLLSELEACKERLNTLEFYLGF